MAVIRSPLRWLVDEWQWPQASLFAAVLLLALIPLPAGALGLPLALVYLQLPLYLLHQFEEHHRDRFRIYFNARVAAGRPALTPLATFWINALGVWAVDLFSIFLAVRFGLAWGLIALYLSVVNGLLHCIVTLVRREYNPGLWTSLLFLLPFGAWGLHRVSTVAEPGWGVHATSAAVAVLGHVGIMVYVRLRLARLERMSPTLFR